MSVSPASLSVRSLLGFSEFVSVITDSSSWCSTGTGSAADPSSWCSMGIGSAADFSSWCSTGTGSAVDFSSWCSTGTGSGFDSSVFFGGSCDPSSSINVNQRII